MFWVFYYVLLGVTSKQGNSVNASLANLMNLVFLAWPCIALTYSYCLFKIECLSWPLIVPNAVNAGGNEEELRRLENRINEDADLRQ